MYGFAIKLFINLACLLHQLNTGWLMILTIYDLFEVATLAGEVANLHAEKIEIYKKPVN